MVAVMPRAPRQDEARYREAEAATWAHYGLAPEETWVTFPYYGKVIRVRALVHGEGRTVVMVHGNPTAGNVFVPLVAALPDVRAIVVDRPGCGLSEPLDYAGMTPEDLRQSLTAYLAAVIEELSDGPVDLLGNSAGGMAVLVAAATRPDLARTVILEGVPAIRGMRLPRELKAASLRPVARLVARYPVGERDLRRSLRAMGHGALLEAGGPPAPDLAWRVAMARHTLTLEHDLALIQRAATWRGIRPEWVAGKETLEALQAPSLWIVGDRDPFATPARVEAWASHAAASTVRVMEGSGHQPWLDDPTAHARLIARWWATQEPAHPEGYTNRGRADVA